MNYVREYWGRISSGEIVTSRRVKAVYGRLMQEMDAPSDDSAYYFDEETGERPILFIEQFCKQSQGTLGAALKLELFQKAFIQTLFGWLEKDTGYRRFRETLLLVARKNGKTTLLAAIALYLLVADYEGAAEIYSVATKKDQAKKKLTEAVNMVKQSPELRAIIKKRRNDIYFPATASIFEALASDSNTLDGLNSHAVIIDELHAIRDRNLYEVMKQSTSSRRQPIVIMITTSGTVRESVFDNIYELACNIADGKITEDTFLPVLYELDDRAEWTDPQAWIKANPGLGTIKRYSTLASFVERAKKNPEDLPGVLCKDFNVKSVTAAAWLSYDEVKSDATFTMQDVYNTYAIGGCDLSATTDLTCATLLIRKSGDDPQIYVLQHYFLPAKKLEMLDEYFLIALDVFKKIPYAEDNKSDLHAWLSLLTTENLTDAERNMRHYPWLEPIYQEIALLRHSPEEVIGMWSEALRILDENSLKYYVEELKDELDKEKMRIQEKDAEIAALKAELEAHKAQQTDQKS